MQALNKAEAEADAILHVGSKHWTTSKQTLLFSLPSLG